jgi:hypothetical protein
MARLVVRAAVTVMLVSTATWMVSGPAPVVHRGLGVLDAGERPADVEQFQLQGLVQPLNLPGGRGRAGPGQPLGDAVLPAGPLEHHLGRAGLPEPAGELLAVAGEDFEPLSGVADVQPRQNV